MLAYLQNLPGIDASVETVENEFSWGPQGLLVVRGGTVDSTARDSGGAPTTILRQGLCMGVISASGNFREYDPTHSDGSQEPFGVLLETVNLYDNNAGATRNKTCKVAYVGHLKVGNLYGFDEYFRAKTKNRFVWDDLRFPTDLFTPVSKAADYTVLSTDNGTHFFATVAVNFTLPAITNSKGYRFRFSQTSDNNLTVTAPTGKLITFNNAAATSVAFSTAGNKIGASVEIVGLPDSSKYLAIPSGANTMTVA